MHGIVNKIFYNMPFNDKHLIMWIVNETILKVCVRRIYSPPPRPKKLRLVSQPPWGIVSIAVNKIVILKMGIL